MFDHPWFAKNPSYPYVRSLYMPVSWEGNVACLLVILVLMGIAVRFGRTPATLALVVLLFGAFTILEHWAS
jgi:hypothetical protein